jgi:zinc transporter 1/2/3
MVELFWQKFGMLCAILASSMFMGFLPLALKKVSPVLQKRLLSSGNAFAGGVFFAIGFLHLLAEADELMTDNVQVEFPLAYIMAVLGFICVFFVEKVLFSHHHHGNSYETIKDKDEKYGTFEPETPPSNDSGIFAYILTFILSLHSMISGVALGMDNNLTTLISLFVAIISHKWIEAFALGVAINKDQETNDIAIKKTLKLILLYSFMEPMGIVIGVILSTSLSEERLLITQAFILALAAGTFIYVAVVDILPAEFADPGPGADKYVKFMLVLVGITAIMIIVIVFSHSHAEEVTDPDVFR